MDGITQRAKDGGAYMSRDGRYNAKSQGWRCVHVQNNNEKINSSCLSVPLNASKQKVIHNSCG